MNGPAAPPLTAPAPALAAWHESLAKRAEVDTEADRGFARSFGDPVAEYRALRSAVGLLDESDRLVLAVSGPRALATVGGLLTNSVDSVPLGRAVYTFALNPKGRPVAELRIAPRPPDDPEADGWGEGAWLDAPAACAHGLVDHLTKYLPPIYARLESTDRARLGLVGPRAGEVLERASPALGWRPSVGDDVERLTELEAVRPAPGVLLVRREAVEGPGFDLYAAAADVTRVWRALEEAVREAGGRPSGRDAYDVLRVERGVPVFGREITPDQLPQETGQTDRAIDFDKGCYTGQEVVARIHYRGHVNRLLRGFRHAEGGPLPESGAALYEGDRPRGEIRTTVQSPSHGPIALGYARREVEPGARLAAAPGRDLEIEVVELPFTKT